MKKQLSFTGKIDHVNGEDKIIYSDKDWIKKVKKFKSVHCYNDIVIKFEIIDKPMHYLFKYYYGQLLPSLTHFYGEMDKTYVDKMILKKDFLFIEIDNDFSKVEKRHDQNNMFITDERVHHETGETFIFVVGYIPSKACITHDEMKEFITKCEHRLFVDMEGHILPQFSDGAKFNRAQGMNPVLAGEDVTDEQPKFEDLDLIT